MAEAAASPPVDRSDENREARLGELVAAGRDHGPVAAAVIAAICALWSLFQLWIASPLPFWADFGIIVGVPARGVHLAFAMLLCFLVYPARGHRGNGAIPLADIALAVIAAGTALYIWLVIATTSPGAHSKVTPLSAGSASGAWR